MPREKKIDRRMKFSLFPNSVHVPDSFGQPSEPAYFPVPVNPSEEPVITENSQATDLSFSQIAPEQFGLVPAGDNPFAFDIIASSGPVAAKPDSSRQMSMLWNPDESGLQARRKKKGDHVVTKVKKFVPQAAVGGGAEEAEAPPAQSPMAEIQAHNAAKLANEERHGRWVIEFADSGVEKIDMDKYGATPHKIGECSGLATEHPPPLHPVPRLSDKARKLSYILQKSRR